MTVGTKTGSTVCEEKHLHGVSLNQAARTFSERLHGPFMRETAVVAWIETLPLNKQTADWQNLTWLYIDHVHGVAQFRE